MDRKKLYEAVESMNIYQGCMLMSKYNKLLEYFNENEITEDMFDRLKCNVHACDLILENLQTHDYRKLSNALKKAFPVEFKDLKPNDNVSFSGEDKEFCNLYLKGTREKPLLQTLKTLPSDSKFKHILEFFNYSVSEVLPYGIIQLEPIYPVSGGDYISQKCHNIVYHVCPVESTDQILKLGLRCRTGSKEKGEDYRNFPKRIYVFALAPEEGNVKKRLKELVQETFNWNGPEYSVLRCKVNGKLFYRDSSMPDKFAFFTYNNIPPESIEKVNI